jgi:hypothetical protein
LARLRRVVGTRVRKRVVELDMLKIVQKGAQGQVGRGVTGGNRCRLTACSIFCMFPLAPAP